VIQYKQINSFKISRIFGYFVHKALGKKAMPGERWTLVNGQDQDHSNSSGNADDAEAVYEKYSKSDDDDNKSNNNSNDRGGSGGGGDHHDDGDDGPESTMSNLHSGLQRLVLVAAATAMTLGYDVGIMAAAIQPLERELDLNGFQKELAMGSLNFIAAVGALLGGKVANDHGRKLTVKLCCWIFVAGTILMAAAPGYGVLLLGRIVTGVGVGVSFVVAPVYLSEVAPTNLRGQLNTVFDVAINGGILLGYVVGFCVQLIPGIPDNIKWRIMLGFGITMPVLVLWNLAHLPESPRWLVMANQSPAAGAVLKGLGQNPRQVVRTVSSIEEELVIERRMQEQESPLTPIQALFQCRLSKGMRLAIALGFWQQITGTEAVLYYSADFLEKAGLQSPTQRLLGNVFVGLCKLTPELVAMKLVDNIGRRPLILVSAVALTSSLFVLSASFYFVWSPVIVVILLCAVMASFSIGLGPFSFLVASENLGLSERATGMTLCAAFNRCTSGTVALTAVSLYQSLGNSGLFFLYGTVGAMSLPFYFRSVSETSGQSLEELAARNRGDGGDGIQLEDRSPRITRTSQQQSLTNEATTVREEEEEQGAVNGGEFA